MVHFDSSPRLIYILLRALTLKFFELGGDPLAVGHEAEVFEFEGLVFSFKLFVSPLEVKPRHGVLVVVCYFVPVSCNQTN